ncbi:unnamed protein product [Ascophyllum nodosum]
MSGYFDGRNGRLSKTLRDLRDLQFEEICWRWNCCLFFEESPESYLSLSRGAV